jgi:hypothetical protein
MTRSAMGSILLALCGTATAAEPVDYVRDIAPIFSQRCVKCHGPVKQKNALRLDHPAHIREGGDTGLAIIPGDSGKSLLIGAITGTAGFRMPPEEAGEPLTDSQVALLKAWIDQNAPAPQLPLPPEPPKYWAYARPVAAPIPKIKNHAWAANEIDSFLAADYEAHRLHPAPPARPEVLLRRVYLDLVGVPPTPTQLRAFLDDKSAQAYEKVVDELLASPLYGQRWGRHWMDIWRYSDWYGWKDELRNSQRHLWRWRDWIVESLNKDLGYDQMIVQMLAGDEIAPADPDTLRATGFLARNYSKFSRDNWLDTTVEHTAKAFLGVTMNCARCHSHKYDPVTQRDYYRFRAFFEPYDVRTERVPGQANPDADGVARVYDAHLDMPTYLFVRGNDKEPDKDHPMVPLTPRALGGLPIDVKPVALPLFAWYPNLQPFVEQETVAATQAKIDAANAALAQSRQAVADAKKKLDDTAATPAPAPAPPADVFATAPAMIAEAFDAAHPETWRMTNGEWEYAEGSLRQKHVADEFTPLVSLADHPRDFFVRFRFRTTGGKQWRSVGVSFDADGDARNFQDVYLSANDSDPALQLTDRRNGADSWAGHTPIAFHVNDAMTLDFAVRDGLLNAYVNGEFKLAFALPTARKPGKLMAWTYDASAQFLEFRAGKLPEGFVMKSPGGAAAAVAPATRTDLERAHRAAVAAEALNQLKVAVAEAEAASLKGRIAAEKALYAEPAAAEVEALKLAAAQAQRHARLAHAEQTVAEAEQAVAAEKPAADASKQLDEARKSLEAAKAALTSHETSYAPLGLQYPKTSSGRRLALARWIASDQNPLTARVAVNHIWLRHFGQPLVPNVFDFGRNGKPPANAALLDFLAVQLQNGKWSMKGLHRLMVTSSGYRMASSGGEFAAADAAADPDNRFFWRQNPRRMEAEIVRDSLLALGNSLDTRAGGPELDHETSLTTYRRSLYYRHAPEKESQFLGAFDSASATECYRRIESVVPQQALAMINSVLAVDEARVVAAAIARRIGQSAPGDSGRAFIDESFWTVLNRAATAEEAAECERFLVDQAALLAKPEQLKASEGDATTHVPPAADPPQRARENLVQVLMNHNDFVTIR